MKLRTMPLAVEVLFVVGASLATVGTSRAQDVAKGQSTFNQCLACHALDHAVVGPPLGGVIGRPAGSVAGYSYSPLMKAAGQAGLVWTEQAVIDYLPNPTGYLKAFLAGKNKTVTGAGKMVYVLVNEDQRKNVVAYLATTTAKK